MGLKIYLIYLAFVTVNFLKCSFGLIKCFSDSIVSIKITQWACFSKHRLLVVKV